MSTSLVVELLAARPEEELRALRETALAQLRRQQVELDQIEEALAKQSRRGGRQGGATGGRSSPTRQRVLAVLASAGAPVAPAAVIAALNEGDTPSPSRGAIHNMLGRLVEEGAVQREGGRYQLADQDAAGTNDGAGLTHTGSDKPLFTASDQQGNGDREPRS